MVPAIDEEPETYSLGIIQQLSMLSNTTGKGEISMLLLCRQNQKQIFVPRCHESALSLSEISVLHRPESVLSSSEPLVRASKKSCSTSL